ncbi:uncharacterized protein LOC124644656 [Helicoverpa zea]|uniref:uncharacterized protein LOC124644656 n=1 Tax=Helicoverpa zea TaxID=7113 RepID=UPI001F5634FC|nr:uncharacterized protein LOC124644656 [Helicoverpa zea]
MVSYFLSILCLLLFIAPALSTNYIRLWKQPQFQASYDSLEYDLPYVPSKMADRTSLMKEQLEQKDKIITLLTKEQKEVNDAEAFLSAMLRVLHSLLVKKPEVVKTPITKDGGTDGIAWSYYDDLGK